MSSDAMDMAKEGDHLPQEEEEGGFGDLIADFVVGLDSQNALELLLGLRAMVMLNMADIIHTPAWRKLQTT